MVELVINMIYVAVLVVYGIPVFGAFMFEKPPKWVHDTSWRGFLVSPYLMLKEI